ncbi:MAG TPA: amidohydrolase family protein, partial [Firmicutes bacterium]|nr:amidohydrolase family protein [Bacillota bacterium]
EAIRIATVNGAELCGLSDVTGSIEAGKLADIIVIDGNPLDNVEDMRNVVAVMKEGQMVRN